MAVAGETEHARHGAPQPGVGNDADGGVVGSEEVGSERGAGTSGEAPPIQGALAAVEGVEETGEGAGTGVWS
jgi:hypothetical protein